MRPRLRFTTTFSLSVALLLPRLALACPVCVAAEERTMTAYYATTVVLSLLPLLLIGSLAWVVYKRASTHAARADQPSAAPQPTGRIT